MTVRRELPKAVDSIVIGGGIVGVSTAVFLADAGRRVLLLEKFRVAGQQSGRNWGFIRSQDRDPAEMELSLKAREIWLRWSEGSPTDFGLRRTGCLYAANDDVEIARYAAWMDAVKGFDLSCKLLSPSQFKMLVPECSATPAGALYTSDDLQADPEAATRITAERAESLGVGILEGCGALAIETHGGAVQGVETELGFVSAGSVVCSAGATTHRLLRPLGIVLPQQQVRNSVALTRPLPRLIDPCFCGFGLGLRQRRDGSMILTDEATCDIDVTLDTFRASDKFLPNYLKNRAAFDLRIGRPLARDLWSIVSGRDRRSPIEARNPETLPNQRKLERALRRLKRHFAKAESAEIQRSWAGYIDVMPDALPVIEASPAISGLVIATGFSGHGFGIGPAVGQATASLALGQEPLFELSPFASKRFAKKAAAGQARI